jgi:ribosomal subunit interface protein
MKLTIKGTNFTLTSNLRRIVEQKMNMLDKFLAHVGAVQARVEIGKTTHHHRTGNVFRAETQLHVPGKEIRAEATAATIYVAFNEMKEELQRELKQYKQKQSTKLKRGARRAKRITRDIPTGVRDE